MIIFIPSVLFIFSDAAAMNKWKKSKSKIRYNSKYRMYLWVGGKGVAKPFIPDDSCGDDIFEGAMEVNYLREY